MSVATLDSRPGLCCAGRLLIKPAFFKLEELVYSRPVLYPLQAQERSPPLPRIHPSVGVEVTRRVAHHDSLRRGRGVYLKNPGLLCRVFTLDNSEQAGDGTLPPCLPLTSPPQAVNRQVRLQGDESVDEYINAAERSIRDNK